MEYMILTLSDGSTVNCLGDSYERLLHVQGNINMISNAMSKITNANLKNATLGGEGGIQIKNKVIDDSVFTAPDSNGIILLTYSLRDKDNTDIIMERLDEQDAALMELAEMIVG